MCSRFSSNFDFPLAKARTGCAYLRTVCLSEWQLFRSFFSTTGQNEVYQYLETLCDNLYDSLRPRILHEQKLEVLCELCNVIQALNSLDGDSSEEEEESGGTSGAAMGRDDDRTAVGPEDETLGDAESSFDVSQTGIRPTTASDSRALGANREDKLRFSALLSTILQDAQTRLVFRAQNLVQAAVLHYQPKPEDLEYPDKLRIGRVEDTGKASQSSHEHARKESMVPPNKMGLVEEDGLVVFKLPPEEITQSWYPTLQRTLWVLSKLHSYVNVSPKPP